MIIQTETDLRSQAADSDARWETPWPALIEKIQTDDASGMEELYRVFSRGVRFYLWRRMGTQDLEDTLHDTFLIVTEAIRRGELREPDRLLGFIWTVVRRQLATRIDQTVQVRRERADVDLASGLLDHRQHPELDAIVQQRIDLAYRVLSEVPLRDREILTRFYMKEQSQGQICREMKLSGTQFRLLKSRAKARFGELGKRRLLPKTFPDLSRCRHV